MKPTQIRILVRKSHGKLSLFDGDVLIKTYLCITGTHPGDKTRQGDRTTPLGKFRVVYKNPLSKFHLSMGLNYPSTDHARAGLQAGMITSDQYTALLQDIEHGDMSDPAVQDRVWNTPLGGEIFIHGCAEGRTDTAGCIAVSNPDMTELYAICPVGTSVEILP